MSNRFMLIIGVAAGVVLVLAISAFANRAREPRATGPAPLVHTSEAAPATADGSWAVVRRPLSPN